MQEKVSKEDSCLLSFFVMDMLVPVRKLYGVASRQTYQNFRAQGLKTYKVKGLGVCVRPSELKKFLEGMVEGEGES